METAIKGRRIICFLLVIVLANFLTSIFISRFLSIEQAEMLKTALAKIQKLPNPAGEIVAASTSTPQEPTHDAKVQKLPNPVGEIVAASTSTPQEPTHDAASVHTLPPSVRGTNPVGEIIDSSISPVHTASSQLNTDNAKDGVPVVEAKKKVSSSRPILRFGVGNGLSNQFMSFIDAMIVAILYKDHYDVELPTMWGHAQPSENKSQPMEFGELYDANHFTKCISNYTGETFNIYQVKAPSDFEEKNIVYTPKHDSRIINSDANWNSTQSALLKFAQPRTIVNIGRFYAKWLLRLQDSKSFETRRLVVQCIKPAPRIKNVVSQVAQKMRSTYPSSNIIALHPRLEEDWKKHSSHNKLRDGWIPEKEWVRRLTHSFNITSSATILMIGGANFDRSPFNENNLTAVTKNDFLEPEDLSPFKYRSSLAAIDFFLAKEADNFYGFMWSSMDLMIYESRLYNCSPTNVIHTDFGDKWLKIVSGWSGAFFFYRLEDIACHYRSHAPTCSNIPTLSEKC